MQYVQTQVRTVEAKCSCGYVEEVDLALMTGAIYDVTWYPYCE